MTIQEFTKKLSKIHKAESVRDKRIYGDFSISGDIFHFTRKKDSKNPESFGKVSIDALYNVFLNIEKINTTILKEDGLIRGRVRSPSLAILQEAKFYEKEKKDSKHYMRIDAH